MTQRTGGMRRKTRKLLTKDIREKGKMSLSKFFQKFDDGQRVALVMDPTYQKGAFHPRYYGRVATVIGKQGRSIVVEFKDGGKNKTLIVHPIHLRKIEVKNE